MIGVWTMGITTIVFSRIVSEFPDELKEKYNMQKISANGVTAWKNFSTSQVSETKPVFPYITVIELPGSERGEDLEGDSINASYFTFQIDVFDNQSETRAKNCMAEIVKIMKSMRFQVNSMPAFESKPQEYRMVARFSRIIGNLDSL